MINLGNDLLLEGLELAELLPWVKPLNGKLGLTVFVGAKHRAKPNISLKKLKQSLSNNFRPLSCKVLAARWWHQDLPGPILPSF